MLNRPSKDESSEIQSVVASNPKVTFDILKKINQKLIRFGSLLCNCKL
jgi:hypothetical protein